MMDYLGLVESDPLADGCGIGPSLKLFPRGKLHFFFFLDVCGITGRGTFAEGLLNT